jgi:hypothetical protein
MSEMTYEEWQAVGTANGWNTGGIQEYNSFKDLSDAPPAVQEAMREAAKVVPEFPINPDCTHDNAVSVGEMVVTDASPEDTLHEAGTYDVVRCNECTKADWLVKRDA